MADADGYKEIIEEFETQVEKLFKSMGGTLESFYYAFGDTDLFIIGDFPDNPSVVAAALLHLPQDGYHENNKC
jgi:uncharacterized protein with GYD domain